MIENSRGEMIESDFNRKQTGLYRVDARRNKSLLGAFASTVRFIMSDPATSKPAYRKVVAALVESEERYRVLVEGVRRYAIFMLDPKGIIVTWNRGIFELLGYNREEVVGQCGSMVFNKKDQAAGTFKTELASAKRSGESLTERTNVHKDGSELQVHDTVSALFDAGGDLIGFAKVARAIEGSNGESRVDSNDVELAKALAVIAVEVEHRRQLEAQLLTAIEQERERLGRDLHDDLSQRLAAMSMMLDTTLRTARVSKTGRTDLVKINKLLADAVGVARNLSRGLHPVTLTTQGLPVALEELATRVPTGIDFKWPRSERLSLKKSVALHIYRIAEEAVGNAIRHSGAKKISIELKSTSPEKGILTISDNGNGFRQKSGAPGMGLQNMKYRAGVIGGTVTVSSVSGRGTRVDCSFPIRRSVTKNGTR